MNWKPNIIQTLEYNDDRNTIYDQDKQKCHNNISHDYTLSTFMVSVCHDETLSVILAHICQNYITYHTS